MHYLLYATDGTRHLVPANTMVVSEEPAPNSGDIHVRVMAADLLTDFQAMASFDEIQQLIARFSYKNDGVFSIEDLERDEARLSAATMKVPAPELRSVWPEGSAPCATTHGDPRAQLLAMDHKKVNAAWRKMWEGSEAPPDDVITYRRSSDAAYINCGFTGEALFQLIEFMRMQCRPKAGCVTGPGDCASYPAVTGE